MKYPAMIRIRQNFKTNPIQNIAAKIREELSSIQPQNMIASGESVAIAAGSRGIANLAIILAELVSELKKIGAKHV